MSLEATVCEPMKAITHNQQLQASPSGRGIGKPIGVINLATKLADDPFHDVGSARHSWMIEVSEEIRELVLKGEDLPFQSAVLEGLPSFLPDLKPEVPFFFGSDVEQTSSQSHEGLDSFTRALIEVAEVVVEKLLHVAHAKLQGDCGEDLLAGAPHSPVTVDHKPFEGIRDFVSEQLKHRLPVFCSLASGKAGHRDILCGGVSTEQQGVMLALDEDGLSIEQEIATPGRLKLVGDLDEAFAVRTQGIDPLKDVIGAHVQFTPHSSVGGFSIEVQMSGAQDETTGEGLFPMRLTESFLTVLAPPTSKPARPQPLRRADFDTVKAVSLCG